MIRLLVFSAFIFGFSFVAFAADQGRIIVNSAMLYAAPDFSAPVIGRVARGQVFFMSQKPVGAFFKIRIKEGLYAFVSDSAIQSMSAPVPEARKDGKKQAKQESKKEKPEPPKKKVSFENAKLTGISFDSVNFREDTMGIKPTAPIFFIGFRMTGPGLAMGSYADIDVSYSPMAPKYYEQATGVGASGFVIIMDMILQSTSMQGPNTMTFLGFGPMFKYSKFNVGLDYGGRRESYSMDNMSLGAVFDAGVGQRIGNFTLRIDMKYFWEKMQYLGYGLAGQMEF